MKRKQVIKRFILSSIALLCILVVGLPAAAQYQEQSIQGIVKGMYDNEYLLMQADVYWVVHFGKEAWNLGIRRGDTITVTGKAKNQNQFKNSLEAKNLTLVQKAVQEAPPLSLKRIGEVSLTSKNGDLVVVYGNVVAFQQTRMILHDGKDKIAIELGSRKNLDLFSRGDEMIIIGEVKKDQMVESIKLFVVLPRNFFERPGEPSRSEPIAKVLKDRPLGTLVKVTGRISVFIGKERATTLYEGEHILVVQRSDKYLSLDVQAGQEVQVVGIFDIMSYEDREYGVIKEARIDPLTRVKELETKSSP